MLDIEITIKPLFELSQPRKEKTRLTPRIENFLETNFFQIERTANDVVEELSAIYKTKTPIVSVILNRKVQEGMLKVSKKRCFNFYKNQLLGFGAFYSIVFQGKVPMKSFEKSYI